MADPVAEIDGSQMLQVLTNMISNAYAAMPQGGTLTLTTADAGEAVKISIADTGTGIAPEHRSKIFEPFFTTKQIGKGTGLGLAVSYGIVKMHRGRIIVESNNDPEKGPTGSTFIIELPRIEEE
jgi:signal transduction histidine kinase